MFLAAFAALHDPASRAYYDKCRARGKTHTQALLRLSPTASACCSRCSATAPSTNPAPSQQPTHDQPTLDKRHRGTPPTGNVGRPCGLLRGRPCMESRTIVELRQRRPDNRVDVQLIGSADRRHDRFPPATRTDAYRHQHTGRVCRHHHSSPGRKDVSLDHEDIPGSWWRHQTAYPNPGCPALHDRSAMFRGSGQGASAPRRNPLDDVHHRGAIRVESLAQL